VLHVVGRKGIRRGYELENDDEDLKTAHTMTGGCENLTVMGASKNWYREN
jgi:hypothetical protein